MVDGSTHDRRKVREPELMDMLEVIKHLDGLEETMRDVAALPHAMLDAELGRDRSHELMELTSKRLMAFCRKDLVPRSEGIPERLQQYLAAHSMAAALSVFVGVLKNMAWSEAAKDDGK